MTMPPVRHTRYDDDDSIYELCRTLSAGKDPCEGDTDATRAARFTKRVQDGESKALLTALRCNPKPPTKIDHERVRRMSWSGLTPRQISAEFNVGPGTIRRILARYSGQKQMEGPRDG